MHLQPLVLCVPLLRTVGDAQVPRLDGRDVPKAAHAAWFPCQLYAALEREQLEWVHGLGPAVLHVRLVAVDSIRQDDGSFWDAGLRRTSQDCDQGLYVFTYHPVGS